jgi:ABC-type ATPase with predicted acetyltransferase domain
MSLLEEVLKAREEAEGKPQCQKCKHLFGIDKGTPLCKFIKCELVEGEEVE